MYKQLCRLTEYRGETTETIEQPTADNTQEAWLKTLTYIRNHGGELPNATTSEELEERYRDYAGLVVTKRRQVAIDEARKRKGSKKSTTSKASVVAFDEALEYPDEHAEEVFRLIEEQDALLTFYNTASPLVQKAIQRFAYAFGLQEKGEKIPTSLRTALKRDRKRTGLALELKRG